MKTVLIIDTDLGFVFWLGTVLDACGCQAIPAKDVPNAVLVQCEYEGKILAEGKEDSALRAGIFKA